VRHAGPRSAGTGWVGLGDALLSVQPATPRGSTAGVRPAAIVATSKASANGPPASVHGGVAAGWRGDQEPLCVVPVPKPSAEAEASRLAVGTLATLWEALPWSNHPTTANANISAKRRTMEVGSEENRWLCHYKALTRQAGTEELCAALCADLARQPWHPACWCGTKGW
jgi:hypothetical protein